jgi:hypothetical protein
MLKKVNRPRCADCGSTNIVLEGQGEWDASIQAWAMRQPRTIDIDGAAFPIDETESFFCRVCRDIVGLTPL